MVISLIFTNSPYFILIELYSSFSLNHRSKLLSFKVKIRLDCLFQKWLELYSDEYGLLKILYLLHLMLN